MANRVFLAGGTGVIGRSVAARLSAEDAVELHAPARIANGIDYERLCANPVAELGRFAPHGLDVAISCLGTTIRKAGSQAAMRRVDHDYVVALARGAAALGATRFILTTSAGAGGAGFYLRTKGDTEREVEAVGFARLDLIRPGLLLGDRDETRPGEALAQLVMGSLTPFMRGPLDVLGAIDATTVADAISTLATTDRPGRFVHGNTDLRRLARAKRD